MANKFTKCMALAAGALLAANSVFAQDGGLLELLLRKGVISDQEAEDLRAEMSKEFRVQAPTASTSSIRLTGDVRARVQYDNEVTNFAPASVGPNNDRTRYRYRFRLGVTGILSDNWTAGVRLETANGATSTNADFGAPASSNFAKDGDTAYTGQVFLQYVNTTWSFADRVDLRFGKHAHPFFVNGVNGFYIDSDLNFEGLSQEIQLGERLFNGWRSSLRAGQYILSANSRTTNRFGGFVNHPSVMLIGQYELAQGTSSSALGWKIAPTFIFFAGPEVNHTASTPPATTPVQWNNSDVFNYDDLATVILPIEYTTRLFGKPFAAYATYGYNIQGAARSNRLYATSVSANGDIGMGASGNPSDYNQLANVGFRLGQSKNKWDWQLTTEYRYIESGAYTSVLLDSDFNAGRTNGSGFITSGSYNITDAVVGTITYFHSENIDKNSPSSVGYHQADVLQVDLSAKF